MEAWEIEVLRAVFGGGGWLMALVVLLLQRRDGTSREEADQDFGVKAGRDFNLNVFSAPTTGGTAVEATSQESPPSNLTGYISPESGSAHSSQPVDPAQRRHRSHRANQPRLPGL